MNTKEVENWLTKESKNNVLAHAYVDLLKNATPEMRDYWLDLLGKMLGPVIENQHAINAMKESK